MNTKMTVSAIASLIVCVSAAAAQQSSSLDAPVVIAKPSVRTEIYRGGSVALGCTSASPTDIFATQRCIGSAGSAATQKMGDASTAFLVGLYFYAWLDASGLAVTARGNENIINLPAVRSGVKADWNVYRIGRKTLGLTDDQVIEALRLPPSVKRSVATAIAQFGD